MKKILILILAAAMGVLLCGCASGEDPLKDGVLTWKELTMELPEGYVRLNTQEYQGLYTFTYGSKDKLVVGYREPADLILGQYPGLTKEEYGQMAIQSARVDAQLEEIQGITCFTFTDLDLEDGKQYTYLAAVYQCPESFWLIQTCCETENYQTESEELWQILKSVTLHSE